MSEEQIYESRWDGSADSPDKARVAVDGSPDEQTLRHTGAGGARLLKAALDIQPTDRVFELGCGVARVGRELAPDCAEWHGADISRNMLRVAGERLRGFDNTHLHKLDRTELKGLKDDYFDKAYAVAVLIHLDKEDVLLYLHELARVLKPGGLLYFDTWNLAHEAGWKRWLLEVDHWASSDQSQRKDVSRNQFSVLKEIRLYLEHAGLTDVAVGTESPFLQVIAARQPSPVDLASLRRRVEKHEKEIFYSARWGELFSIVMDLINGRADVDAVLADLERRDDEDSAQFRDYIRAQFKAEK